MLNYVENIFVRMGNAFLTRPSRFLGAGALTFSFGMFISNALVFQSANHPDPIWQTREMNLTRVINTTPKEVTTNITRSVLTQAISLKNIPVPTARPMRKQVISAHSTIVRDVQEVLAEIDFYAGKVDGIYGDATKESIIAYQESSGIIPDGEASYGLLASLKAAATVVKGRSQRITKQENSTKPQSVQQVAVDGTALVKKVQKGLVEYGIDNVTIDGIIGNQTREAIRSFQSIYKLPVTGEPDQKTVDKLVQIGLLNAT